MENNKTAPAGERGIEKKEMKTHIVSYKTYAYVWVSLLILLGITIAAAKVYFSKYSVLINLLIASIKAVLVLMFFMHLKYEGRFLKGLVFLSISVLTLIIALTFSDVWFR
jgi:cytochrome c oxidase subunit 4